jgi:hypothetical protein
MRWRFSFGLEKFALDKVVDKGKGTHADAHKLLGKVIGCFIHSSS